MKRLLLFLTAALLAHADSTITLNLDPTKDNPRNSEGSFATLASGRIIFCYSHFYGGAGDESPARIVRIHSDDQGRTWSQPVTVVENTGGDNVMSVSLLRLASGKLAMFYCIKNSWIDCRPHMRISTDEGETWSQPKLVLQAPGYFVMNNDRVIQTSKGRIVIPLAFHRSRGTDPESSKSWDARAIAMWIYSDDEGATWTESSSWWAMAVRSGSGLQEPGVVELADGGLFSWCRTDQGAQYGFYSTDAGKTFSPPVPTEMKSPNGPASIKRLPGSSDLLAIYNDHSGMFPFPPKKRNPYVAAISTDGGKTWPKRKLIESDPDGLYHYTAIHFVGDAMLIGYCAGDSKVGALNRLRIRRITLDWLKQP
ncbi:sialidase family protein [Prosthecobacter vanneervenii]|uniref:Neuraminidase (Sialidase) n=1 Tax=Prosthecobacter vanneervenii TaxID=48466 RepID=A0A7W7Y7V8_9BACT|nr:sialidase family protein [Prosthecobacter vanneervenii]MBB5031199.1 Neuraminidase (sialidase) [Prosthecobacter vanneervenii]